MRVAILAPGWIPDWTPEKGWGGIEKVTWYHAKYLQKLGVDAHFVNVDTDGIAPVLHRLKPDIVHYHIESFFVPLQYYVPRSTKKVFTSHASWVFKITSQNELVNNYIIGVGNAADFYLSLNYNFEKLVGRKDGRSCTVPNAANEESFYPGDPPTPNTFLCVGKHDIFKKFAAIAKVFRDFPQYHLTIVGPEGEDTPNIRANIGPNVELIGNVSEKRVGEIMRTKECGIHMSDSEMDCLVVREMLASGLNVITSDVVFSNHREGGRMIQASTPEEVAQVLNNYESFRISDCQPYEWSWTKAAEKIKGVYESL